MAFRFVQFSNSEQQLVSWCAGKPTCLHADVRHFESKDYPHNSKDTFFGDNTDSTICICGASLFDIYAGSEHTLQQLLQVRPGGYNANGQSLIAYSYGRKTYTTVVLSGKVTQYGIVLHDSKGYLCLTCPTVRCHCEHVAACLEQPPETGSAEPASSRGFLSPAAWEKKFRSFFDFSTGQRKLKCLSRADVPEDTASNQQLENICHSKS